MLRKSLAVLGLLSVVLLANPADARRRWHVRERPHPIRELPTPTVPEPGAVLLFGVGALLVRRELHRR